MWIFKILVLTLFLSITFSLISELVVKNSPIAVAFIIIVVLIVISIGFDIIGTATASCNVETFLAMASRKLKGAKLAVYFAKNSSFVTAVCCDVIGDICGILSGAAGSSIAVRLIRADGDILVYSIILSAFLAATLITCKAIGKVYAIKNSDKVVIKVARILSVFKKS